MLTIGAQAADPAMYPDLRGAWSRFVVRGLGGMRVSHSRQGVSATKLVAGAPVPATGVTAFEMLLCAPLTSVTVSVTVRATPPFAYV
jgi:hypothetical protein